MKGPIRSLVVVFLTSAVFVPALGCRDEGPAERAGRAIDEAMEDTGEAMDDAADQMEESVEEAKKKME